jgi:hypothetical protein
LLNFNTFDQISPNYLMRLILITTNNTGQKKCRLQLENDDVACAWLTLGQAWPTNRSRSARPIAFRSGWCNGKLLEWNPSSLSLLPSCIYI